MESVTFFLDEVVFELLHANAFTKNKQTTASSTKAEWVATETSLGEWKLLLKIDIVPNLVRGGDSKITPYFKIIYFLIINLIRNGISYSLQIELP